MAVLNQDDEQDPNNPSKGLASTGGSGFVGGGSSSGQGATTSAGAAAPTSSGSYTNLNQYIGANQGNDATMGKAAANTVGTAGKAADTAIDQYGTAGAADAKQGTANIDQGALSAIKGGTSTVDQSKLDAIKKGVNSSGQYTGPTYNASYTGPDSIINPGYSGQSAPTNLAEAAPAYSAINSLLGTKNTDTGKFSGGLVGQASGGQADVGALLHGTYTQPSYTAGENQLDSFLTSGGTGGQAALQGIKDQWGGEGDKLSSTESGIASAEAAGQKTSNDTQNTYAKAIADANTTSNNTQQTYSNAIKAAKDAWKPPAVTIGTTSSDAARPAAPMTAKPASTAVKLPTAAQAGKAAAVGAYGDPVPATKLAAGVATQLSNKNPGSVSQAGKAGAPIIAPPPPAPSYPNIQTLINPIAGTQAAQGAAQSVAQGFGKKIGFKH